MGDAPEAIDGLSVLIPFREGCSVRVFESGYLFVFLSFVLFAVFNHGTILDAYSICTALLPLV